MTEHIVEYKIEEYYDYPRNMHTNILRTTNLNTLLSSNISFTNDFSMKQEFRTVERHLVNSIRSFIEQKLDKCRKWESLTRWQLFKAFIRGRLDDH